MKKIFVVLAFLCSSIFTAPAQVDYGSRHGFHIAYLGEMVTHPGISVGYENYLNEDSRFQVFLRATVGFYHHFRNNNTYKVTLETGFRRNFRSGLFLEQSLGLGYFYRSVDSDGQFSVDENGGIIEKDAIGTSFLPFLANVGIGYHIQTRKAQISPFLRPNFYWKMPLNEAPNMQMSLMAGFIYSIK